MTVKVELKSRFDKLKWALVCLLVVAAAVGNFYFSSYALSLRAGAILVVIVAALAIASLTDKGRQAVSFLREARIELRKVVWPARKEVQQTTLIVGAFVVVAALVLWGVDSISAWAIKHILFT
ncbi:preprotein translocase subunit SecE [Piscirickettsia litoralis]|uniref:Protein translocase subunit SecE n=1 Tax=Piscirickettsia litoralis TaxID=1891921 RepID=A0ABX3A5U5_9GAMM|nr:preprotein translocase subunit SecE [Piscirickettsia litoralis]ODN42830.1 preprotein translocase subunit SecE [Piscirickettsia litoralis]